jgi:glycosyltransferase involved in cell wall biosynthesis
LVEHALRALASQNNCFLEVRFYDQLNSTRLGEICTELSNSRINFVVRPIGLRTLSSVRNLGLIESASDFVLYLDADAVPHTNWAEKFLQALNSDTIAVVGSRVVPVWENGMSLFALSTRLQGYYSIFDHGISDFETAWVIGASFGINRRLLRDDAYFREDLGRAPGSLRSGEEIELCIRAKQRGFKIKYLGSTEVHHFISNDRSSIGWIARRIVAAGKERGQLGKIEGAPRQKRNKFDFLFAPFYVPLYIFGYTLSRISGSTIETLDDDVG